MQIPVPKGRTITKFYKKYRTKKIEELLQNPPPQNRYLRFLHDNAPTHKAHLGTEFLESDLVTVLLHPPFSPDLAPATIFCFKNSNIIYLERDTIQ